MPDYYSQSFYWPCYGLEPPLQTTGIYINLGFQQMTINFACVRIAHIKN